MTEITPYTQTLDSALLAWADATTDATSKRRADLLRDKGKALVSFFDWVIKDPGEITPGDVKKWQAELEARGYASATVYAMISRISSFYRWAKDGGLPIGENPVTLARPKAPKAYQTKKTKALSDVDLAALVALVRSEADTGKLSAKRDYAMLLLYVLTGMRREEIAGLAWGDVKMNGVMYITTKVKGGDIITREVKEPAVRLALLDYLETSNRLDTMTPDTPLWVAHDRSGKTGKALTSHAFSKNLKRYAKSAGLDSIHVHQTRHTFARIVAEETGSMVETQDALGHSHIGTTRVYVKRVGVKRDKSSSMIASRLDL